MLVCCWGASESTATVTEFDVTVPAGIDPAIGQPVGTVITTVFGPIGADPVLAAITV